MELLASFKQLLKSSLSLAPTVSHKLALHGRGGPFYGISQILVRKRDDQEGYYPVQWAMGIHDRQKRTSYITRESEIFAESMSTTFVITMFSGLMGNYWQIDGLLAGADGRAYINGATFGSNQQPFAGLPPLCGSPDRLRPMLGIVCHADVPLDGKGASADYKILPVEVLREYRPVIDYHRKACFSELPPAIARRVEQLFDFLLSLSGYSATRGADGSMLSVEGDHLSLKDLLTSANDDWGNLVLHLSFLKGLEAIGETVPESIMARYKAAWEHHVSTSNARRRPASVVLPQGVAVDVDGVAYLEDDLPEPSLAVEDENDMEVVEYLGAPETFTAEDIAVMNRGYNGSSVEVADYVRQQQPGVIVRSLSEWDTTIDSTDEFRGTPENFTAGELAVMNQGYEEAAA